MEENSLHVVQEMIHRIELLEKDSFALKGFQRKSMARKDAASKASHKLFLNIHTQITQLQQEVLELQQAWKETGNQLKECIRLSEFVVLQEQIQTWPLEEYLPRKQLPVLFETYAKQ